MRKTTRSAVTMGVLATGVALARTPWPPDMFVSPASPGVSDVITLRVSDTWPHDNHRQ